MQPARAISQLVTIVLALVLALVFTTIVLMAAGAPPLAAYVQILQGAIGSWSKFAHVIRAWIPLTLCAVGLLYPFRIGLWNIGVEGQVMMGAVFATAALRMAGPGGGPGWLTAAFAAAAVGGGVWAALAGVLKTHGGVHEIFAGLGLNFVAQGIVLWLIFGPWKRPGIASMSGTELFPKALWLSHLPALRLSPAGVLLTLAALVLTAAMLRYSRIGLSLTAVGSNPRASVLFGLRPARHMLSAMLLGGALAGAAGAIQVTDVYHRLIPAISSNYGYLGLLVVMLAGYRVWLVPVVALFFACLNVGSIQLPMVLKLDSSLSGVIQGALVLATLAVYGWRSRHRPVISGPTAGNEEITAERVS